MFDFDFIRPLTEIPPPVLSVYLHTNPAELRNHDHPPGYMIWLKTRGKELADRVAAQERKAFQEQFQRVQEHLDRNPPAGRGAVIFAGPKAWHFFSLRVDVQDELVWGPASLTQLLWLIEEHRPCGLVVADRSGMRFFRYGMGEMVEDAELALKIDTSQWHRMDLMPPSQPGTEVIRGSHRDKFERRVEAQIERFYSKEVGRIRDWAERLRLNPLFLSGPPDLAEFIETELPKSTRERLVRIHENLWKATLADLQPRLEAELKRWNSEYERNLLNQTLENPNGVKPVLGIDPVLDRLQQGLVYRIVTLRGLDGPARQCVHCGWTAQGSDGACPACGREWRQVSLRTVLPLLARRYSASLDVVDDPQGKLTHAGGIAGWLRA